MKIRLTSPTFDASAKTVVHSSFSDVTLAGIQLITNVTDNIIIYNFADATKGGTLSTDTLTLDYDTTSMDDTDELMVLVEDGIVLGEAATPVQVEEGGAALTSLQTLENTSAVLGSTTYTETSTRAFPIGAVRRDADTTLVNTTNEIAPLQVDANGRLKVEAFSGETLPVSLTSTTVTGTVAVTQSGTWDEVGINDSGNSITVDGTITASNVSGDVAAGAADSGNPVKVGGKINTTMPTYSDGQRGELQIGTRGSLKTALFVNNSSLPIDTKADNSDDVAVSGNADKLSVVSRNTVFDGTTWDRMPGDSTGVKIQDGGNSITVDNSALTELAAAINSDKVDVNIVSGGGTGGTAVADDADFTAGTTLATPVQGVYESTPTSVTDGDLGTVGITQGRRMKTSATIDAALPAGTNAIGKLAANSGVDIGDVDITSIAAGDNNIGNVDIVSLPALAAGTNAIGKLLPPDIDVTTHTNYAKKYYTNAGAVTDGIVWSPAAGKRWHVVSLFIQVSAAATVTLEDDKSGGDEAVMKMELAANSGISIPFPEKYPLASGEDAADLIITTSAGNVYVTCVGYEI